MGPKVLTTLKRAQRRRVILIRRRNGRRDFQLIGCGSDVTAVPTDRRTGVIETGPTPEVDPYHQVIGGPTGHDLSIGGDELERLLTEFSDILRTGRYVLGERGRRFEGTFARYLGVSHVLGTSSGSSALWLALLAGGVRPGQRVALPAITYVACVEAVLRTGAVPWLVDVDPDSGNVSSETWRAVDADALMVVHLHGRPAHIPDHPLVIEDFSQAHGATIPGPAKKRAGAASKVGACSFYPSKALGACGDAGAVVTDDPVIAALVRRIRNHGAADHDDHELIGSTERLDELQAAVLLDRLPRLNAENAHRRGLASQYCDTIRSQSDNVTTPVDEPGHVYHQFAVAVDNPERVQMSLSASGIRTGRHYRRAIHQIGPYLNLDSGRLQGAEHFASRTLSLPLSPRMSLDDVIRVANALCQVAAL